MRRSAFVSRAALRAMAMGGAAALCTLGWAVPAVSQNAPGAPPAAPAPTATPAASTANLDALKERAAAFWAARVSGDFTKQWEFLEPRGRGRTTAAEYAAPRGVVKYLAYQVEDAKRSGSFARVKVRLIVQASLPIAQQRRITPSTAIVDDLWVTIGGTWYRTLEQGEAAGSLGSPR